VKTWLLVSCANFFALRILWRVYSEELCDRRGDVDVVDFLEGSPREVWATSVEYGLHLGQPWIMAMLSEKRRRLKEVAYCCSCAALKSR
jgi:hypothetical protein